MTKDYYELHPNEVCKDIELLTPPMQQAVKELQRRCNVKIVETWRSLSRQKKLKAEGKSKTLKSRHLLGIAVDIYPLPNGYKTSASDIAKIQHEWKLIASRFGYPNTSFLAWDSLHFSFNNGKQI